MTPLLSLNHISAYIPGDQVRKIIINNVSLQIYKGCHLGLIGPNGAGKSTLLRIMAGLATPCSGAIYWQDQGTLSSSAIAGQEITGLISPQRQVNWQLHPCHATLGELLQNQLSGSSAYPSQASREFNKALDRLACPELAYLPMAQLSQGQLRLALLVVEFLRRPPLLLLDEWDDGLDSHHRERVLHFLSSLRDHITMIFTSHRIRGLPNWIMEWYKMDEGQVTPTLQPETCIYPQNNRGYAAQALKQNKPGATIFNLKNVSVYKDRHKILHGINWTMISGEHWRIQGPNGAGKSTFLRLLAGEEFAASGGEFCCYSVKNRRKLINLTEKQQSIRLVSDLSQALYGYELTCLELLLSGFDNTIGLYRDFSEKEEEIAQQLLIFFFGDTSMAQRSIRRLSSGQLRKMFLARALAGEPEVLLLDEPCTGLDSRSRENYLDALYRLVDKGLNSQPPHIIMVSHHDEDVPSFIKKNALIENGILQVLSK